MRKIIAHCGIGYQGAKHVEEFEFPDDMSQEEIDKEVYEWALQYLEVWWDDAV